MDVEGLINVCQAVKHGNLRYVRNLRTQTQGVVVAWGGGGLTVQVGEKLEEWQKEDCEDICLE